MNLDIYKHNLRKMSEVEFAQETHRISKVRKNDPKHAAALWRAWVEVLDERHPLVVVTLPV